MKDRVLVYEDFAGRVGEIFVVSDEGGPAVALTLTEAELLRTGTPPPSGRPPYSLTFVAEDERMLPQRIYRIEQEALGEITLFLVPIGKDERGISYQALFN